MLPILLIQKLRNRSGRLGRALTVRATGATPWVPVRTLQPRHRERVLEHMLALQGEDRYLRFGHAASDDQVRRYVAGLDFAHDELFGIFDADLTLVALAHLAYPTPLPGGAGASAAPAPAGRPPMAEFGVSVRTAARGRGHGARLFAHAGLHARNRGVDHLFIHALTENTAMLHIARKAGAKVERDGSESEAWLRLPDDNIVTQLDEALQQHAAEMHYRVQVQTRQLRRAWARLASLGRRSTRS